MDGHSNTGPSIADRWQTILNDRTTIRIAWIVFVMFLVLVSAIQIGDFSGRVMQEDQTTAGPFIAHLLAAPELYDGNVITTLRPLGFLSVIPIVQWAALKLFDLDPLLTSYVLTVTGNVAFILALYAYGRVFLIPIHAVIAALLAYILKVDTWSLALMGNLQVYPTAGDFASALVIVSFACILRERWVAAAGSVLAIALIHPAHAIFCAIPCALVALFDCKATWRETILRMLGFAAGAAVAAAIPLTVMRLSETDQVSNDYIVPLMYGLIGQANAWRNTGPFVGNLLLLTSSLIGFLALRPRRPRLARLLVLCAALSAGITCIVQWVGIALQLVPSAILGNISASRCSVYVAYLTFPVLYFGLVARPLTTITALNFSRKPLDLIDRPKSLLAVTPQIILALGMIVFARDAIRDGAQSKSAFLMDGIAVSKWMASTPPKTRFLTTDRDLIQDSFSLRPATLPIPYFLTAAYRVRDHRAVQFDEKMVRFWGPPRDSDAGWLERYWSDVEQVRLQHMTEAEALALSKMYSAQYLVTFKTSSGMPWPVVFQNASFIVFLVPQ
jgi:hypothetical protein